MKQILRLFSIALSAILLSSCVQEIAVTVKITSIDEFGVSKTSVEMGTSVRLYWLASYPAVVNGVPQCRLDIAAQNGDAQSNIVDCDSSFEHSPSSDTAYSLSVLKQDETDWLVQTQSVEVVDGQSDGPSEEDIHAIISAPRHAELGQAIGISAAQSSLGEGISYTWSVVSSPDNHRVAFKDRHAHDSEFYPTRAGTYRLRLDLSRGQQSAHQEVDIQVGAKAAELDIVGMWQTEDIKIVRNTTPLEFETTDTSVVFLDGAEGITVASSVAGITLKGQLSGRDFVASGSEALGHIDIHYHLHIAFESDGERASGSLFYEVETAQGIETALVRFDLLASLAGDSLEPNNSPETAHRILAGSLQGLNFSDLTLTPRDVDIFALEFDDARRLSLTTFVDGSELDLVLGLFSHDLQSLAFSDNPASALELELVAGKYYLMVSAHGDNDFSGQHQAQGSYRLRVQSYSDSPPADIHGVWMARNIVVEHNTTDISLSTKDSEVAFLVEGQGVTVASSVANAALKGSILANELLASARERINSEELLHYHLEILFQGNRALGQLRYNLERQSGVVASALVSFELVR